MVRKVDEPEPNMHLKHWKITIQAKQMLQAEKRREEKRLQMLTHLTAPLSNPKISQSNFGTEAWPFLAGLASETDRREA